MMVILLACTFLELSAIVSGLSTQEKALFNGTQIESVTTQGNNIVIKSTGIPDHTTGSFPNSDNPNRIVMVNHTLTVPVTPTKVTGTPGCLPMGVIGISISGAPFFSPYTAQGYNAVEGDYKETFDSCEGHPNDQGVYHYHHVPPCIGINGTDKFIGVALDGFPIYGPRRGDGKYMKSEDLDKCHGTTYQGTYRYYVTSDFPYVLACFYGTPGTAQVDTAASGTNTPPPGSPPPSGRPPGGQQGPPGGGTGGGQCYYAFDREKGQTTFSSGVKLQSHAFCFIYVIIMYVITMKCYF